MLGKTTQGILVEYASATKAPSPHTLVLDVEGCGSTSREDKKEHEKASKIERNMGAFAIGAADVIMISLPINYTDSEKHTIWRDWLKGALGAPASLAVTSRMPKDSGHPLEDARREEPLKKVLLFVLRDKAGGELEGYTAKIRKTLNEIWAELHSEGTILWRPLGKPIEEYFDLQFRLLSHLTTANPETVKVELERLRECFSSGKK